MKLEKFLLGQRPDEVMAAMQEENCGQCFGCPRPTLVAAELVQRTNLLLRFTNQAQAICETQTRLEQTIETMREELHETTSQCDGDCSKKLVSST